jgi:hypothetical protein
MFIMILEITSFMCIFKGWVSWVKSIQEKMCLLIISQGVGFALCNNWRYFCLTKSSLTKHAITLLFTNPPTYIMCSIICMSIRNVKQCKSSKGRNILLVSFEMLLPSHKAIIETWQIHFSLDEAIFENNGPIHLTWETLLVYWSSCKHIEKYY